MGWKAVYLLSDAEVWSTVIYNYIDFYSYINIDTYIYTYININVCVCVGCENLLQIFRCRDVSGRCV